MGGKPPHRSAPATGEPEALAIDAKPLRGSRQHGAPATHLLSVVSHLLGLPLWQQVVANKTNEIPVLEDVLHKSVVDGRVITADALLTQRAIAERIVHGGGDSVMLVKGNQPQLPHDIQLVFHETHALRETMTTSETVDSGHSRLEQRRLTANAALVGYSDWPGLAQVFQIERSVIIKKSGEERHDVVYGGHQPGPG